MSDSSRPHGLQPTRLLRPWDLQARVLEWGAIALITAAPKLLQSCPDSVRPHRQQPTRLPHPWDSPGKNTGVGCHFLLQCMKVKSKSEVAQSSQTLGDPMDCSLPGSSVHGFSRQEYWSGVPPPSLIFLYHLKTLDLLQEIREKMG